MENFVAFRFVVRAQCTLQFGIVRDDVGIVACLELAELTAAECAEHGAPPLHVYRCPYCNGWHLTSKGE